MSSFNRLASLYANAPVFDPAAVRAWRVLADESTSLADVVRANLQVTEVDSDNPYSSAAKMFRDIERGRFLVSRANSAHPVWTVRQNVDFRIAHDVFGHLPSGGGFDWSGEVKACSFHRSHLSPLAALALRTECLGQVAFALDRGGFGPQKVAFI
jgi:hypothetical protein